MKLNKTKIGLIAILVAIILAIGLFGSGCVSGMAPIGWSGGTVANGILYVGSNEGRLVALNLADDSRQWAEKLKPIAQTGMFGCSASSFGCGAGTSNVVIYGTPVVSGDLVYIAGYNGKIYAYNTSNLATRWVYPREGNLEPFVGGMVIAQDKLFVGSSDGKVYSFDAVTGDKIAEFKTGDKIWGTPTVDGDTLYIGSFDKKLYALSADTLKLKWEYTTEGSIISRPLVSDGIVYFGSFDRNLYAVNAADGSLKWKFMAKSWFWVQPEIVDGTIYAGCLDGFVYALKADTGEIIADFNLRSAVSSQPVIVNNYIVFVSHDGVVFSIDTNTNTLKIQEGKNISKEVKDKFNITVSSVVDGPLCVNEGIVYIHTQDSWLNRYNTANDEILTPISLKS